jgi:hypothetical protein
VSAGFTLRIWGRDSVSDAHIRARSAWRLTITTKEQAPQKTMRGLFLMQRNVKRDAEGLQ